MTNKEIIAYLRQYHDAMRRTQAISDHIADLRTVCEQLRTEDGHKIELDKAVAELVDAERRAAAEVQRLAELERDVEDTISKVHEPFRTLLYERYVNGKTWEQIAVRMNFCYYHIVHRLHPKALKIVNMLLNVTSKV